MKKIVICRLFKYMPRLTEYKWLQIEICIILSNLFFPFLCLYIVQFLHVMIQIPDIQPLKIRN